MCYMSAYHAFKSCTRRNFHYVHTHHIIWYPTHTRPQHYLRVDACLRALTLQLVMVKVLRGRPSLSPRPTWRHIFHIRAVGANQIFVYVHSRRSSSRHRRRRLFPLLIGDAMWFGRRINQRWCRAALLIKHSPYARAFAPRFFNFCALYSIKVCGSVMWRILLHLPCSV